jgi:hypothetical protein
VLGETAGQSTVLSTGDSCVGREKKINGSSDANPGFTRAATGRDVTLLTRRVHAAVVEDV